MYFMCMNFLGFFSLYHFHMVGLLLPGQPRVVIRFAFIKKPQSLIFLALLLLGLKKCKTFYISVGFPVQSNFPQSFYVYTFLNLLITFILLLVLIRANIIHELPFKLTQLYSMFQTLEYNMNYFCVFREDMKENLHVRISKLSQENESLSPNC